MPAFLIAKYPITNEQYQKFINAPDGYYNVQWWVFPDHERTRPTKPEAPQDTAFPGDDLPRTNVNWYEAVTFCRWLSVKTGQAIALPTEQQWQHAAQGDDGRTYPWGNLFDPTKCNTNESAIGQTTPVTRYPNGASPYGVLDMAGNVYEWCVTKWGSDDADMHDDLWRVMRGGAWYGNQYFARCVYRSENILFYRYENVGFRVVCETSTAR